MLGYEALARGPAGTPLEQPVELFRAAARVGRTAELDWRCRVAALRGALAADLGSSLTLFVNIEADTAPDEIPGWAEELLEDARRRLRVVMEVTEGAVVAKPSWLLSAVEWIRDRSWGVALDDLGADSSSLAVMPFLAPDVVKLDLRLVQQRTSAEVGGIVSAVLAQAERTGAVIVAEGVENDAHREAALALGATLGQGWLFGCPEQLPAQLPRPAEAIPLLRSPGPRVDHTPFSVVRSARPLRRGTKRLLEDVSRHLEEQALVWRETPVLLSCFERGETPPSPTLQRYRDLAAAGCLVVTIGSELGDEPAPGVRGAPLPRDSPLEDEWSVVLVGAHYSGALVARRASPDEDAYDFAVTHDHALVIEAGRALLRLAAPAGPAAGDQQQRAS